MGFQKGDKKPANSGRKKGTRNKTTEKIKDLLQEAFSMNLDNLQRDLERMSPQARWLTLTGLAKYFMPTLAESQENKDVSGTIRIVVTYANGEESSEAAAAAYLENKPEVIIEGDEFGYDVPEAIVIDSKPAQKDLTLDDIHIYDGSEPGDTD